MACVREPHVQPNVKRKPPYKVVPTKNCPSNGRPRPQYSRVASALCADGGAAGNPASIQKALDHLALYEGDAESGLVRRFPIPKGSDHPALGSPDSETAC